MVYTFCIPMHPMGKARPRVANGHAYMPAPYRKWKADMAKQIIPMRVGAPWMGDLDVSTAFYTKTGNCRSDIDNSHAAVLDVLQDCKVIINDRQVKSGSYNIFKSEDGTNYMIITITRKP